jgi:hypothetical protein
MTGISTATSWCDPLRGATRCTQLRLPDDRFSGPLKTISVPGPISLTPCVGLKSREAGVFKCFFRVDTMAHVRKLCDVFNAANTLFARTTPKPCFAGVWAKRSPGLLGRLSAKQPIKTASSNMLLCRFRGGRRSDVCGYSVQPARCFCGAAFWPMDFKMRRPHAWGMGSAQRLRQMLRSAQQSQHTLRNLVGLRHHGGTSLLQDLASRQIRCFRGKVGIHDSAPSGSLVL